MAWLRAVPQRDCGPKVSSNSKMRPGILPRGNDEARLVDWRNNAILWRLALEPGAADLAPIYAFAQPNGSSMAFSIGNPNTFRSTDDLWLIGPKGTARKVVAGPIALPR